MSEIRLINVLSFLVFCFFCFFLPFTVLFLVSPFFFFFLFLYFFGFPVCVFLVFFIVRKRIIVLSKK